MTIEQNIFKRAKVDLTKLADYGFKKSADHWVYSKIFMDGNFKAVVKIDVAGNICGDVYDTDSDDIYFPLRVESMEAGFVGAVRFEYEKILQDIKEHCCRINYFIYPQANRLAQKIYEKYGDVPCFPWDKFAGYGVFKNPENNKWYALVMNIDFAKLDQNCCGETEAVNLKVNADKIPDLITHKGFYSAYHMNKKNWITIVLDDSITDDVLFELLDESHAFTLFKQTKQKSKGI